MESTKTRKWLYSFLLYEKIRNAMTDGLFDGNGGFVAGGVFSIAGDTLGAMNSCNGDSFIIEGR